MYFFSTFAIVVVPYGTATEAERMQRRWDREILRYNDCQNAETTDADYLAIDESCPVVKSNEMPSDGRDEIEVWFARHAESTFNEAMGDPAKLIAGYTGDMFKGVVKSGAEFWSKSGADFMSMSASTDTMTTTIMDAPLSLVGIAQAMRLRDILFNLCNRLPPSECPFANLEKTAFATSNLRRAAMTLLIVLSHRDRPIITSIKDLVQIEAVGGTGAVVGEGKADEGMKSSESRIVAATGVLEEGEAHGLKSSGTGIVAATGVLEDGEAHGRKSSGIGIGAAVEEGVHQVPNSSRISILSSLQEFQGYSFAIDTLSQAAAGQRPILNPFVKRTAVEGEGTAGGPPPENLCKFLANSLTSVLDPRCNKGNQVPVAIDERLNEFCDWVRFKAVREEKEKIFVTGHSHWLIKFFNQFGPRRGRGGVDEEMAAAVPKMAGGALNQGARLLSAIMKRKVDPVAQVDADENRVGGWNELERDLGTGRNKIANAALIRFKLKFTENGGCVLSPGSTATIYNGYEAPT